MPNLSKIDLAHLLKFVDNYEYVLETCECMLLKHTDTDEAKVVRQILEEKINE